MKKWKFLLYGVTGNLAQIKILPSLAQFAEINQNDVSISLTGYSRSLPDTGQITKILNENTSTNNHFLTEINFFQGQYEDKEFLDNFIDSCKNQETAIIYMALPPNVFINILQNSCNHYDKEIKIIVEKPFGQDYKDARKLLQIIKQCDLGQKVHFFDHYLFKNSTLLTRADLSNLKSIKDKTLLSVSVQALENIGVENRSGYYDQNGALKDMLPHLFSMIRLAFTLYKSKLDLDFLETFKVEDLLWGQYTSYTEDVKVEETKTETYFQVQSSLRFVATDGQDSKVSVFLESGKKLGTKKTRIFLDFDDGSQVAWKIQPEQVLELVTDDQNLSLSLNRNKKHDHTNLFESLLSEDMSRFVSPGEILASWWIYDKILEFKNFKFSRPRLYQDNQYPVDFLDQDVTRNKSPLYHKDPIQDLETPSGKIEQLEVIRQALNAFKNKPIKESTNSKHETIKTNPELRTENSTKLESNHKNTRLDQEFDIQNSELNASLSKSKPNEIGKNKSNSTTILGSKPVTSGPFIVSPQTSNPKFKGPSSDKVQL